MARPDEISDLMQGLESLHKAFLGNTTLTGDTRFLVNDLAERDSIRRGLRSFIPQQDNLFSGSLGQVQEALQLLTTGDSELAKQVLKEVQRQEGSQRRKANWAEGNQSHHYVEGVGNHMAASQLSMPDAIDVSRQVNMSAPLGTTAGRTLSSQSKQEHGPISHFNRETSSPNAFGLSEIIVARDVLGKNPKSIDEVVDLYTPIAEAEYKQSLVAENSREGIELRQWAANKLGISVEELISTEPADPNRKTSITKAENHLQKLQDLIGKEGVKRKSIEIYGDKLEAQQRREAVHGIPVEQRSIARRPADVFETFIQPDGTPVQIRTPNTRQKAPFIRKPMTSLAIPGNMTFDDVILQVRPGERQALRRLGIRI